MSGKSKRQNIVLQLNALQPGLNFVIPSYWWAELLEKNASVHHIHDLLLPDSGPLDTLIDLQIVNLPMEAYEGEYTALIEDSVKASNKITNELRKTEQVDRDLQMGKRSQPFCSWWKNQSRELSFQHKILYSPYVSNEALAALGLEDFAWVVVSPNLYRLISKRYFFLRGEPFDRIILGIPIVLQQRHFPSVLTYDLRQTQIRRVELYNFNRCCYAFIGHVESKQNQRDFLSALYQGMEILCEKCDAQFPEDKRNRIILMKNSVYYDFYDQETLPPTLNWQPFENVADKLHSQLDLLTITEFSSYIHSCYEPNQVDETGRSRRNEREGRKRVKPNEEIQETGKKECRYAELEGLQGGQRGGGVVVVSGSDNGNATEVPSSTQGQTPDQYMRQLTLDHPPRAEDAHQRIPFPLWTSDELPYYRKFCDQQMNCYLPVLKPFLKHDSQDRLMVRENSRKYYIDLKTNQLQYDENGRLEEKEKQEEEIHESADIPQDILRYLEGLAVSLGKERTETVPSEVKEEAREVDLKDKEEFQSLTCKEYEDMEEQQSRQF